MTEYSGFEFYQNIYNPDGKLKKNVTDPNGNVWELLTVNEVQVTEMYRCEGRTVNRHELEQMFNPSQKVKPS